MLEDVSLDVAPGEFVALVGPNGSGKSTLLRVLLGSLIPERGIVRLFGEDPVGLPRSRAPRVRAAAPVARLGGAGHRRGDRGRRPAVPPRLVAAAQRRATATAVDATRSESVGLADLADRPINQLSGGQQQRAFIARAFASEPSLLVLDEPIAGVDAESQRRFRDAIVHLIAEHGSGVLLVSHELSAVARTISTGSWC